MNKMLNLRSRKDDIWIVGMPRSGTTWMEQIAWLVKSNFDFDGFKAIPLREKSVFVE